MISFGVVVETGLRSDQLKFEIFDGFYEPEMAHSFFPTYKKHERYVVV